MRMRTVRVVETAALAAFCTAVFAVCVVTLAEIQVEPQPEITGRAAEVQRLADEFQADFGWFVDLVGVEKAYRMWIVTGFPPIPPIPPTPAHSNQDGHSNQDFVIDGLNPISETIDCFGIGTILCGSPPICVNCDDPGCLKVACQGENPSACNEPCEVHALNHMRGRMAP